MPQSGIIQRGPLRLLLNWQVADHRSHSAKNLQKLKLSMRVIGFFFQAVGRHEHHGGVPPLSEPPEMVGKFRP
jgi:uncharacterized membrane protein YGL010W